MEIAVPIQQIQGFLMVLFRVSGILFFAPIFGSSSIPPSVKILIALTASLLFFPAVDPADLVVPNSALLLAVALAGEMLIGVLIGLLGQVISVAVQYAGRILGAHMGLRIANVLDPQTGITVSLIGAFFNIVTVLLLLYMNFHIIILRVVRESFSIIKPLGVRVGMNAADVVLRAGSDIYLFAMQVAAPILAAIFFVEVIIAVLAKMAKQFNMLMLQFPIKILLGFIFLGATMRVMPRAVHHMLGSMLDRIGSLLNFLG